MCNYLNLSRMVRDVEATVNQDKSQTAEEIQKLATEIQTQPCRH